MEMCLAKENENNFALKQIGYFRMGRKKKWRKTINRKLRGERKRKRKKDGEKRGNLVGSSWLKIELLWQEFKK